MIKWHGTTHKHTLTLIHTHKHTLTHTLTHTHSHTLTQTHTHSHTGPSKIWGLATDLGSAALVVFPWTGSLQESVQECRCGWWLSTERAGSRWFKSSGTGLLTTLLPDTTAVASPALPTDSPLLGGRPEAQDVEWHVCVHTTNYQPRENSHLDVFPSPTAFFTAQELPLISTHF